MSSSTTIFFSFWLKYVEKGGKGALEAAARGNMAEFAEIIDAGEMI